MKRSYSEYAASSQTRESDEDVQQQPLRGEPSTGGQRRLREEAVQLREGSAGPREWDAVLREWNAVLREWNAVLREGAARHRKWAAGLRDLDARLRENAEGLREDFASIKEVAALLVEGFSKLREGAARLRLDAARLREGEVKDGAEGLATDLSFLANAKFCDVTLCACGREFRTHRAILAARSPVFAAMLEHDMLEKAEDRVDIEDLDGDVLHQLLRYVYTGSTALDTEDEAGFSSSVILSLLAAADKYSLPKLKEACSAHLRSNLDNAVLIRKTDDWLPFLKDYRELASCAILRLAMQHK